MQRANILALSSSSYPIVRLYHRRSLTTAGRARPTQQRSEIRLPLLPRHHQPQIMRLTSSSPNGNGRTQPSPKKGFGGSSFATSAFVAAATASTSYAAYYCATTAFLFGSVAVVNGETTSTSTMVASSAVDGTKNDYLFKGEKKRDDKYGIEYVGFDSYPGIHLDDGTGVATREFKAASLKVVSKALDAAGLDEKTGMMKGFGGDDITIHPKHAHRVGLGTCPVYGCPFLPMDVHYEEEVKTELENMRKESPSSSDEDSDSGSESGAAGSNLLLRSSGSEKAATLTLIGYKGGRLEDQINQDRALALAPFMYWNIGGTNDGSSTMTTRPMARLIGAFDGHAKFGEKVSEYVVKTLPALLGSKLAEYDATNSSKERDKQQKDHDIGQILRETFLELDATSPADPSGGCTATVVLQLGTKIYIANAGDSRSFIMAHVAHHPEDQARKDKKSSTAIIYGTREDKPHLSTERVRVEHMGGTVYLPNGFLDSGKGTTRVLYQDPMTGSTSGLAMSRSIGDWDAGEVGVVPDPLIDILDIKEIKTKVLGKLNEACKDDAEEVEIDPATGESVPSNKCVQYTENDVKIFAVSASDGMCDYLPPQAIANHVAQGLYGSVVVNDQDGQHMSSHPLLVCEDLIYAAAQGWQEDKGGRYRDDIAIAITDLELE